MGFTYRKACESELLRSSEVEALKRKAGDEIVAEAKRLAPVLTGRLRDSLRYDAGADEVVTDAEHAVFVEYGTSDTPPQPFLRPAGDSVARRYGGHLT